MSNFFTRLVSRHATGGQGQPRPGFVRPRIGSRYEQESLRTGYGYEESEGSAEENGNVDSGVVPGFETVSDGENGRGETDSTSVSEPASITAAPLSLRQTPASTHRSPTHPVGQSDMNELTEHGQVPVPVGKIVQSRSISSARGKTISDTPSSSAEGEVLTPKQTTPQAGSTTDAGHGSNLSKTPTGDIHSNPVIERSGSDTASTAISDTKTPGLTQPGQAASAGVAATNTNTRSRGRKERPLAQEDLRLSASSRQRMKSDTSSLHADTFQPPRLQGESLQAMSDGKNAKPFSPSTIATQHAELTSSSSQPGQQKTAGKPSASVRTEVPTERWQDTFILERALPDRNEEGGRAGTPLTADDLRPEGWNMSGGHTRAATVTSGSKAQSSAGQLSARNTAPRQGPVVAEPAPVITVSIGRIEVRAAQPTQTSAPRPQAASRRGPSVSLDAYLKSRGDGK